MQIGLDANAPWHLSARDANQPFAKLVPGEPLFDEYLLVKIANGHAQIPERMLTDPVVSPDIVGVVCHPWRGRQWFDTTTPMPECMYLLFSSTYKDQNPCEKSKKWDQDFP